MWDNTANKKHQHLLKRRPVSVATSEGFWASGWRVGGGGGPDRYEVFIVSIWVLLFSHVFFSVFCIVSIVGYMV